MDRHFLMQTLSSTSLIRVFLVEDDIDFQQMLQHMIDNTPDMELLTIASIQKIKSGKRNDGLRR